MYTAEYEGINSLLVGVSKNLLENGVTRNVRGFECVEFPEPVILKIRNPSARWITIPERKWNPFLPYAESLWLASGRNDLKFIKHYLARLSEFSDDGEYIRGGYGPRLRNFSGNSNDYKISKKESNLSLLQKENKTVDQFLYIEKCFQKDVFNRQAIITIGDPAKDTLDQYNDLKTTKDLPCTRLIQLMCTPERKLDMTVYMRSNDLIWGASGVNIFNFTFIQEYFAGILGLEIGSYYHIANNLHYYKERHQELIERLAIQVPQDKSYIYNKTFKSLQDFDNLVLDISNYENDLRTGKINAPPNFQDEFINDWASIFYKKFVGQKEVKFINPILNKIFSNDLISS